MPGYSCELAESSSLVMKESGGPQEAVVKDLWCNGVDRVPGVLFSELASSSCEDKPCTKRGWGQI